jgi:predicted nucleic-acid-binding protein
MIGLDTNVLLRYFLADDRAQNERAVRFVSSRCSTDDPGFVNRIALCEMVWVLTRSYKYGRAQIAQTVEALLVASDIVVEDRDAVWRALNNFENSGAGFTDLLMSEINRTEGCEATATFDRKAARLDSFVAVP